MADENMTAETGMDEKELNTVRDILFGAKTREHEQRFEELRKLWTSSLDEARGEFRARLEEMKERLQERRIIRDAKCVSISFT